jgi:hypothetical protein
MAFSRAFSIADGHNLEVVYAITNMAIAEQGWEAQCH